MKYTVIAFAHNTPGVLYRIADLFLRRKINIESLTVSETERDNISRFTIVVKSNKNIIEKIVKQLYRIIEIVKVFESEDKDLLFKEIAMIKVHTRNNQARQEIENLAHLSKANIIAVGRDFIVLEKTGAEEEIDSLKELVKTFGIKEFIRSGRIAFFK